MRKCEAKARHIFDENGLTAQILVIFVTGEEDATTAKQIKR